MKRRATFVENDDGIHLLNPIMGYEFTMCGDAFDAHTSENMPGIEFNQTTRKTITCPKCAKIVLECRGVMVDKRLTPHPDMKTNEKLQRPPGWSGSNADDFWTKQTKFGVKYKCQFCGKERLGWDNNMHSKECSQIKPPQ